VFQQDNASINTAIITRQMFEEHRMNVLPWPANSPDLNPIENLWGKLAREVYKNGRQYDSLNGLKNAIIREWKIVPLSYIENLIQNMNKRCFEVIRLQGNKTKY
jgi:transposase